MATFFMFQSSWLIVNQLEQDIILKIYTRFSLRVGNIERDSIWIMQKQAISEEIKPFAYLNDGIDSVVVSSVGGKCLKVWRKSEQTGDKRQFFDENSWKKRKSKEGNYINYEWTFVLMAEDLQI